jgi:hypothetical protein
VETKRALIEQAHQLHELTKQAGWAVLVDFMEVRTRADKLRVLNGKCVDIDDYRKLTGFLIGVHAVLDAPSTVQELADNARRRDAEHNENDAA